MQVAGLRFFKAYLANSNWNGRIIIAGIAVVDSARVTGTCVLKRPAFRLRLSA